MRTSRWLPVVGWCLATTTSIVLSSVALLPVLKAARADPGPLPDLGQAPATAGTVAAAPAQTRTPIARPTTSAPAATRKPVRPNPRPTTESPVTAPATTAPPSPTPPPPTTEHGWTVTTDGDGRRSYLRSFRVEGGQAVIRMTDAGVVSLVTATPAGGFSVEQVQSEPANLAVYFNQPGKSYIIHAQWWGGQPYTQISEVGSKRFHTS